MLIFFMLLCVTIYAQAGGEQQVASKTDSLNKAYLHPEKAILDNLLSDDVSYGHSAGLVQNKAEIINGLINGPFHFLTISTSNQTIKVVKDMAIVRQTMLLDYTDSEKKTSGKMKFGILLIWHLENTKWKLLARQAILL